MKETFYPFQNLCIDESLVLFKSRIFFKQYIPSKRHEFGVKFFLICDCETGYILDFIIYTGKYTDLDNIEDDLLKKVGISGSVVLSLMKPFLGNGHSLYLDNWYERNARPGTRFGSWGNAIQVFNKLLALKWRDKREVFMLTTMHNSEISGTGKIDKDTGEEKETSLHSGLQ
ncbi:hypothetical protein NQ314_017462 [Rhamnusium bicolor]|uniref:PiggyBac transposable element-derived protein domain-containing protein n=1 Tax=Rhamnusium bicolor TaxID=1586634 RepID=A0AAV8WUF8_9CUCU|nr:hypothetical protein NQ314_017462 [Rhamnusium bicolor]